MDVSFITPFPEIVKTVLSSSILNKAKDRIDINYNIIFVDDGSIDKTWETLQSFSEKDKKSLLKEKLQAKETKLLLRYKEVHEGLAIQVVKQISFLIFKFFLSISMKT